MAQKRTPKVVVFEEPRFETSRKSSRELKKERDKFLRGDVSDIFNAINSTTSDDKKQEDKPSESGLDLRATLREVESLAASSFNVKEKRKFEEQQVIALGGKPPKSDYVPYPHYQRVVKSRRDKERRELEQLRCARGSLKLKRKAQQQKIKGQGRWKERTRSLEPTLGTFKKGVLKLSRGEIQKVSKTKNRSKP